MGYTYFSADELADRTLTNLEIIFSLHEEPAKVPEQRPFEVTQLVNSFLGALVFPWEGRLSGGADNALWSNSLDEACKSHGVPVLRLTRKQYRHPATVGELIENIRNAISHGGIRFRSDDKERPEIAGIEIFASPENDRGNPYWEVEMTVDEMKKFLSSFVSYLSSSEFADIVDG